MEKKKVLTEEEKQYEISLQQELDLSRLQRRYEILERYKTETCNMRQTRQNKVIAIFNKEQQNILIDLKVATNSCKRKEDIRTSNELQEVLQTYDDYTSKIKRLKEYLQELDRQIYLREREVLELETLQTTDRQFHERVSLARTTVEKLENKLEVSVKKFGSICYENRMLRDKINILICERTRFNGTWSKLINNLKTGKKFMLDLIEQATIAYDQREEWVSKLQILRRKSRTQMLSHLHLMRELERKHDNDIKIQEFILVKGERRLMLDLELKEKIKRRRRLANIELKMENYKKMINSIFEFANEEDAAAIVKRYLFYEQENFAMFLRLIELNEEMEGMNEALFESSINIDQAKIVNEERRIQQEEKLEVLSEDLKKISKETQETSNELQRVENMLQHIINGTTRLFNLLKCDNEPLLGFLGKNDKIGYFNITMFLQILEKGVQEKLVTLNLIERSQYDKKKLKKENLILQESNIKSGLREITDIVGTNPCPLCVEHELVHDVIDSLQKVMTKTQVQEALEKRLELPDGLDRLHNVSACHLPKSRAIMQKRYQ